MKYLLLAMIGCLTLGAVPAAYPGACNGAINNVYMVPANKTNTYRFCFTGSVSATITATATDGVSDIDMVVLDAAGAEVATDRNLDSAPTVTFTPASTQTYRIQITNNTNVDVEFGLVSN